MAKQKVLNIKGEQVKDITLTDTIWKITPNDAVLYDAVVLAQASLRSGTHDTKTRAEVSGGGRKPWKQKGTGRARQGSIRAPQWRGGGIVFGPHPRDYDNKKMNKKERRLALKSALAYKFLDKELIIVDSINLDNAKTKAALDLIKNLGVNDTAMFVTKEENENLALATRNLSNLNVILSKNINVLEILKSKYLVVTEDAIVDIEEALK